MTKRVALADATYARLRRWRRPGESFSQVIERLMAAQAKEPEAFAERVPKARVRTKDWLAQVEADREATRVDA